jgi:hypothetical protein
MVGRLPHVTTHSQTGHSSRTRRSKLEWEVMTSLYTHAFKSPVFLVLMGHESALVPYLYDTYYLLPYLVALLLPRCFLLSLHVSHDSIPLFFLWDVIV